MNSTSTLQIIFLLGGRNVKLSAFEEKTRDVPSVGPKIVSLLVELAGYVGRFSVHPFPDSIGR
jgi:hypothetical protein